MISAPARRGVWAEMAEGVQICVSQLVLTHASSLVGTAGNTNAPFTLLLLCKALQIHLQVKCIQVIVPKSMQMVTEAMKLKDACSWKNSYNKPRQCIKKQRIIQPTKVHLVKAIVSPGVMYGCESWTIKKAEHRRTDAFKLLCWRRLLRVP